MIAWYTTLIIAIVVANIAAFIGYIFGCFMTLKHLGKHLILKKESQNIFEKKYIDFLVEDCGLILEDSPEDLKRKNNMMKADIYKYFVNDNNPPKSNGKEVDENQNTTMEDAIDKYFNLDNADTKKTETEANNMMKAAIDKYFGNDNNPPQDTADYHYEVGMAKGRTEQISRDWAKANANQALAQYVRDTIESIIVSYVNDAGEASQEKNNMLAMQAFEFVSKQKAQATLSDVTYKFQTEKDGTVFVLACMPKGKLTEGLKANLAEAFGKNPAAVEANNMMNAAIDKYFNLDNADTEVKDRTETEATGQSSTSTSTDS